MEIPEIHINRRGINSIEPPDGTVAHPGEELVLALVNHGGPLHLTVSAANSRPFTPFDHQKIFLQDREEVRIPIRGSARPGTFELTVIAGYGSTRQPVPITVEKRPPPPPPEEPGPEPREGAGPAPDLRAVLALVLMGSAIVMYVAWTRTGGITVHLAFAAAVAGFVAAWFRRRSP